MSASKLTSLRQPFRTRSRRVAAATLVLASLVGLVAGLILMSRGGAVERVHAAGPAQGVFTYVGKDGALRLLQPGQVVSRVIAPSRHYGVVRISRDGASVAAVDEQTSGAGTAVLHLIDVARGTDHSLPLPPGPVVGLAWSPRQDVLAVIGSRLELVSSIGAVLATSANHSITTGTTVSISGGGYGWSPDGSRFGAVTGSSLVVLETNGHIQETSTNSLVGAPGQVGFDGWTVSTPQLPVVSSGARQLMVGLNLNTTTALDPNVAVRRIVDAASIAHNAVATVAGNGTVIWDRPTGDGQAVAQFLASDGSASFIVAAIQTPSRFAVVSGLTNSDTRGGALVDAIISDP